MHVKRMIKRIAALLPVLSILLCACQKTGTMIPELLEPAMAAEEFWQVERMDLYTTKALEASVTATSATVSFERSGVVEEVFTDFGETVEQGQLLIRLSDREDLEKLAAAQKQYDDYVAESEYVNKVLELKIKMTRLKAEASSDSKQAERLELEEQALWLEDTYNRSVQEHYLKVYLEELEEARAAACGYDIYAPAAGEVVYLSCEPGDDVKIRETAVVVADVTAACIETGYMTESSIREYDFIYAYINGEKKEAVYLPYSEEESNALIYSGERLASRFQLKDGTALKAGDFVAVEMVSDFTEDALVVPTAALHTNEDGRYVLVEEDGEKAYRPVQTGISCGAYTEILEGVTEGERVALSDTKLFVNQENSEQITVTAEAADLEAQVVLAGAYPEYEGSVELIYDGPEGRITEVYKNRFDSVAEGELVMTVSLSADPIELLEADIALQEAKEALQDEKKQHQEEIDSVGINDEYSGNEALIEAKKELLRMEAEKEEKETEAEIALLQAAYDKLAAMEGTYKVYAPCSGFLYSMGSFESQDSISSGTVIGEVISGETPALCVRDSNAVLKYNSEVTIIKNGDYSTAVRGRVVSASDIVPSSVWGNTAVIVSDEIGFGEWNTSYSVIAETVHVENVMVLDYALINDANGYYSVRIYENGNISTRYLSLGLKAGEQVWVLWGLEEGERIIRNLTVE